MPIYSLHIPFHEKLEKNNFKENAVWFFAFGIVKQHTNASQDHGDTESIMKGKVLFSWKFS